MNILSSDNLMDVIQETAAMQQRCLELRAAGKTISFVPTMGYLHEGHLSLLREGRKRGDILVLSIFVNPTQFGPNEDLDSYPRNMEKDLALAETVGTDLVWTPTPDQVYPPGYATYVDVEGLTNRLCGASRPGHFRGVTTVVCKLLNVVQPNIALFGQKDFQQLAVIRRMVADLNIPVEIEAMPIVREDDGLAMSSRNFYLTTEQRQQALVLSNSIKHAQALAKAMEHDSSRIITALQQMIDEQPEARVDYLQICHQFTLKDQDVIDSNSVLLLAVFIGSTRLIDNSFLL
jgi:pantoate--beta-alanine ligase